MAQARGIAVVQEVLARPGRGAVLVTHGALLTLLLRHFDPRVGYAEWSRLSNPDLFRVEMRAGVAPAWSGCGGERPQDQVSR